MFTDAVLTAATVFVLMLLCLLLGAPPLGAVLIGLSFGLGSYAYPHALTMFTEPGTALCVHRGGVLRGSCRREHGANVDLFASGALRGRGAAVPRLGRALPAGDRALAARCRVAIAETRPMVHRPAGSEALFASAPGTPLGAIGPLLADARVNWWRYGSVTNFGYALGTATNQSYPIVRGVVNQWFSSGKSLFLFAPIALVVVFGLVRAARKAPMEIALLGSLVVVNTLFFARVQFWSGDWAWGPRYLQIVVPCLAAMAAPLMDRRAWRRAFVVVSVLGFFFAALPAVLVRFTLVFYSADKADASGPRSDRRFGITATTRSSGTRCTGSRSCISCACCLHAFSNSLSHVTSPLGPAPVSTFLTTPRLEFWWLRARDLGTAAVLLFASSRSRPRWPACACSTATSIRHPDSAPDRLRNRLRIPPRSAPRGPSDLCTGASADDYDLWPMGNLAAMGNLAEMAGGDGRAARRRARALDRPAVPERGRDRRRMRGQGRRLAARPRASRVK